MTYPVLGSGLNQHVYTRTLKRYMTVNINDLNCEIYLRTLNSFTIRDKLKQYKMHRLFERYIKI